MNVFACDVGLRCSGYRQIPTVGVSDRRHPLSVIQQSEHREVHNGPGRLAGLNTTSPFLCGLLKFIPQNARLQNTQDEDAFQDGMFEYFQKFADDKFDQLRLIKMPTIDPEITDDGIDDCSDYVESGAEILRFFQSSDEHKDSIGYVRLWMLHTALSIVKLDKDRFVILHSSSNEMTPSGWLGLDDSLSVQYSCVDYRRHYMECIQRVYGAGKEFSFEALKEAIVAINPKQTRVDSLARTIFDGFGLSRQEGFQRGINAVDVKLWYCQKGDLVF